MNYRLRNCCHVTCNAQNISNSSVLNRSPAIRSDSHEYLSPSSSSTSFSMSVLDHGHKISPTKKRMVEDFNEENFSGKLDQWVKDSVVEIVNYLDEAPFLVYIYSDDEEQEMPRLVKEKACPENWPVIKERLGRRGKNTTPNGIILVEEIDNDNQEKNGNLIKNREKENSCNNNNNNNRVWGILIQGKGANYPVCYMLKTCRVACVTGFCTHFCLARVECFVEALDLQFMKLWLL